MVENGPAFSTPGARHIVKLSVPLGTAEPRTYQPELQEKMCSMGSKPTRVAEVTKIVENDLANCDDEQRAIFLRYGVEPYEAPILRHGEMETVIVVARKGKEVIYWEDVEEGFNLSPVAEDGRILEHWCNQDELGLALNAWVEGRTHWGKLGPAAPIR